MEERGKAPHMLTLDQRKQAVITGVNDVCSFHENEVVLKVESGVMVISGENLHVGRLLPEEGRVEIRGRVDAVNYEAPHVVKRLFGFGRKP